jgi:hypothetical protein
MNLWISKAEIDTRPMSGDDWTDLLATADVDPWPAAEMDDQDSKSNLYAMSGALVYLRTGTTSYRETRIRTQLNGGTKGYAFTHYTHSGRSVS